jgi:protein gp37
MQVAARFSGKDQAYAGLAYRNRSGAHWTGKARLIEEHLADPLRWQKPRRVFVNSMSDLFHESISNETIASIFAVMALAEQHTFQILTKRPERMLDWFQWVVKSWPELEPMHESIPPDANVVHVHGPHNDATYISRLRTCEDDFAAAWPLPNVWLGVSVEDQKTADKRIPLLLQTPAAVRWISAEPLLGAINLDKGYYLIPGVGCFPLKLEKHYVNGLGNIGGLDWIVVGGESGLGARPMHPDWARGLRDQCVAAGIKFFFKQWGGFVPCEWDTPGGIIAMALDDISLLNNEGIAKYGAPMKPMNKKDAGRMLDGRKWDEYPE